MTDFDLKTLYNFRPPRYLCKKCLALLVGPPFGPGDAGHPKCPVCPVEYISDRGKAGVHIFMDNEQRLRFDNLLQHCTNLAGVTEPDWIEGERAPLRMLLEALSRAQVLVHFISFGISEFFMGALKTVA